ncbi:flavin reductase family protein [Novosphingobium terrae]|uniref:flavin reductase family protein n=1 Tax=Novosphingobium terrae TaxID=2726189 RepID=UPI00197E72F5|nr:flavin reductase family protein [Novosphingobium terrae]
MGDQQADFKNAMRRLAATVGIISAGGPDTQAERHGITATAITSLSMDPPALLVCINRSGSFHPLMLRNGHFCVNLLRSAQAGVSNAFAGKLAPADRFLHGEWDEDELGVPFLRDAQANIFCTRQETVEYGSHSIFIGAVRHVALADEINPLLFVNGAYGQYAPLALD